MQHIPWQYSLQRALLFLNLGLALLGGGLAVILREVCTNMEITGWIMFATGAFMAIFAVVWSLGSWTLQDKAEAAREARAVAELGPSGGFAEVPVAKKRSRRKKT